jgi:hypothetical protein
MEMSNQQPEPEDCSVQGNPVDLWYHQKERAPRSVSREKREPQTGPASCSSNSASKVPNASGDAVIIAEPKTDVTVKGKVAEDWPGSQSVARAEGNTSNEGGPEGPCRTNYEDQAGREAQRQEVPPELPGVGLAHSIQGQPRAIGADLGEGANSTTQSAQATSAV